MNSIATQYFKYLVNPVSVTQLILSQTLTFIYVYEIKTFVLSVVHICMIVIQKKSMTVSAGRQAYLRF